MSLSKVLGDILCGRIVRSTKNVTDHPELKPQLLSGLEIIEL